VLEDALGPLGLLGALAEVDECGTASIAVIKRPVLAPSGVVPGVLGRMTRYRGAASTAWLALLSRRALAGRRP
jgi:hypothetical protein